MTQTLTVQVGADGVLALPLGTENANKIVRLTVEVIDVVESHEPTTREERLQFIKRMAGCITDPTFVRHPQGEYEKRDELE